MKKVITTFLIFSIVNMTAMAVQFDESVDANIRQNYGVEESSLPPLPSSVPTLLPDVEEITTFNPTGKTYTLKYGTKVRLQSKTAMSDWGGKGRKVSFLSKEEMITKEGAVIPAGTVFKGTITNVHRPQITGNGGLIEFKVDEIYFNGIMSKIDSKLCSANEKKVFFGNIKGKRMYWKNFGKAMDPATKFFDKSMNAASAVGAIPVVGIIAVVPFACGVVFYALSGVTAPFISAFRKGGSISLPSGTEFEIKITESSQIKG